MASFQLSCNYNAGDKVAIWGHTLGVYDENLDPYYVHEEFTATKAGGMFYTFTYDPQKGYIASIYINDSRYTTQTIDPVIPNPPIIEDPQSSYTSIEITIKNVSSSDSIAIKATHGNITYHGNVEYYSGYVIANVTGLQANTTYDVELSINGDITTYTVSTDPYPIFSWSSNISKGANIPVVGGNMVAPVTAEEWNRLISYIQIKFGLEISTVQPGDELNLYSGGNVYNVAKALGITVTPKTTVTAEFFNKLKDAYNSN